MAKEAPQTTNVIDLMSVPRGSLDQARGQGRLPGRGRPRRPLPASPHQTGRKGGDETRRPQAPPKPARTASKGRQHSGGKGDLRQLSKAEPYQRAAEQGIEGRSG